MTTKAKGRKRVEDDAIAYVVETDSMFWVFPYKNEALDKLHDLDEEQEPAEMTPLVKSESDAAELRALRRVARAARAFLKKHGDHCPDCDVQRNTPESMSGCNCPGDAGDLERAVAALKKARR